MAQNSIGRLEIYPGRVGAFDREKAIFEQSNISPRNRSLMVQWQDHLFAKGSGFLRIAKLSSQLRRIIIDIGKDLDTVLVRDIEALLANHSRNTNWTETTRSDYRRCIKQFYTWFQEIDPRLEIESKEAKAFYQFLKKHVKRCEKITAIDYGSILNDSDIQVVLEKGCKNVKQRAFIALLHEGGFRLGEFLNIRIKDIEVKKDRILVQVDGKTGSRRVPLVQSMGAVVRWLEEHPFKNDPHSFLWIGDNPTIGKEPLICHGAKKLILRCFNRAGQKKRRNPHWFRHSRATINAQFMTEAMLCRFFGWSIGSRQVRRYVHADIKQVEEVVMTRYGIEMKEELKHSVLQCSSCSLPNRSDAKFCDRCGKALSLQIMHEAEEKKEAAVNEAFELLQKIMSDPDQMKLFIEFQKRGI